MKHIAIIAAAILLCAPLAGAQASRPDGKYSLKAHVGIGLGNAYTATTAVDGVALDKSSNSTAGVDFRFRFWQKENLSLGVNGGLAYSWGNQKFIARDLSFHYDTTGEADVDGDSYRRYTTIENMAQEVQLGELDIPLYVDFNWQFCERVSLYAQAGIALRFSTLAKVKSTTGKCSVYGRYPQYGDLKIDDEWLNDFGTTTLDGARTYKPAQNTFTMSVGAGAGLRVWLYGPLSFECGVNYDYSLINRLKSASFATGKVTAGTAPLTYTSLNGRYVRPLTSAISSDKLSNVSLNLALIFEF